MTGLLKNGTNIIRSHSGISITLALGLALRFFYIWQMQNEAWFISPGMDPAFYNNWASDILNGNASNYIPFPRAPLYAYILAFIKFLFHDSWLMPRVINIISDALVTILIYSISCRLFNKSIAVVSASIYAYCGIIIYYSGEVLMTSLSILLITLFVYTFLLSILKGSLSFLVISGALLGLSSLLRPNVLLLLPYSIYLTVRYYEFKRGKWKKIGVICLYFISAIVIITPSILINFSSTKTFIPISTQGGVNFYIGNARTASGWSSTLPGVGAAWTDEDAHRLAEKDAGTTLTSYKSASHLWKMGRKEITADYSSWIKLMFKKVLVLLSVRETGNNRPLAIASGTFPLFQVLFKLSFGALFPFALLGVIHLYGSRTIKILTGVSVVYSISILVFFVNSRYRLPLLPFVCVLAGGGLMQLIEGNALGKIRMNLALVLLFAIPTLPLILSHEFNPPAQVHYVKGNALLRTGEYTSAIEEFQQTINLDPEYPSAHLNSGVANLRLRNFSEAKVNFEAELNLNPESANAWNNLGVVYEYSLDYKSAIDAYRNAMRIDTKHSDARLNLGRLLILSGDSSIENNRIDEALGYYYEAADVLPSNPKPAYRIAAVYYSTSDLVKCNEWLDEALIRNSSYKPALDMKDFLMVNE